jgi:hypothetical protein
MAIDIQPGAMSSHMASRSQNGTLFQTGTCRLIRALFLTGALTWDGEAQASIPLFTEILSAWPWISM